MNIREFGVEIWMNAHETSARYNLAETCCDSLTVAELLDLAGQPDALDELLPLRLDYGAIEGTDRLRAAIGTLYARPQSVITTHGAIGANALLHAALVSAGDRVVSLVPNYQQHVSIPESLGAEVVPCPLRPENGWLPDLEELARLATPGTRLIAFSNPNNPTGALMDEAMLREIAAIARRAGAWVLSDEVYRGIDQRDPGTTAAMADLYEKGISVGSLSKAFSLAGLRTGWIAGPEAVIRAVSVHRDYTTISVGRIDEYLAALALEAQEAILARNRALTRRNLAILSDWIAGEPRLSWVRPEAGTTAFPRLDAAMASAEFCERLQTETGVMFTPGSALDMEGHLRIGFACGTDVLRGGLARTSGFLAAL